MEPDLQDGNVKKPAERKWKRYCLGIKDGLSLKIEKQSEGIKDTVLLSGRLDTTTAPELEAFMEKELKDTQELVFDLTDLEYISSAGLRVLLKVQKYMNKKGDFKLTHVSEVIEEIFEITGFSDILTIE